MRSAIVQLQILEADEDSICLSSSESTATNLYSLNA